jgi:ribonuclease P protein component
MTLMIQTAHENPEPFNLFPLVASCGEPLSFCFLPQWQQSRLRHHADYQLVYAHARKQYSASMVWFARVRSESETRSAPARVGLTVGKVLGKAHDRNRIKRRLRAAIRAHLELLPAGLDLILHPRRSVLGAEYVDVLSEVRAIFTRAAESAQRNPNALIKKASPPAVKMKDDAQREALPVSAGSRFVEVGR